MLAVSSCVYTQAVLAITPCVMTQAVLAVSVWTVSRDSSVRQFFFNVAKTPYGYYRPILLKNFEKDFVNRKVFCIFTI